LEEQIRQNNACVADIQLMLEDEKAKTIHLSEEIETLQMKLKESTGMLQEDTESEVAYLKHAAYRLFDGSYSYVDATDY
jgi:hypothetical protein